jgi:hypothetical protein
MELTGCPSHPVCGLGLDSSYPGWVNAGGPGLWYNLERGQASTLILERRGTELKNLNEDAK